MLEGIDPNRVPRHVACVMDGNGRWAQQRGLKRTEGHAAGEEALFDTVEGALELGLDWFTVYAFSPRTGSGRPTRSATSWASTRASSSATATTCTRKGVRIRFIGRRDWRVPKRLLRRIDEADRADQAQHRA